MSPHGKAKAAIYIRLAGGPSHMDTFDLKPGAPDTHRGEFKEIKTNVPGVRICEHLPKLAKQADKFAILRGVHHTLAAHGLGSEYLASGTRPSPALKYPSYGAVVSKEFGSAEDLPAFVAIPRQDAARTGYLGVEYGPFETGATPRAGLPLQISGLTLGEGVTLRDIERRQNMIRRYDNAFGDFGKVDKVLFRHGQVQPAGVQHDAQQKRHRGLQPRRRVPGHSRDVRQSTLLAKLHDGHVAGGGRREICHRQPHRLGHARAKFHAPEGHPAATARHRAGRLVSGP